METGSSSTTLIIYLILAAPVLLILVAFGLVALWRKKSQDAVTVIVEQIQAHDSRLTDMQHFMEEYAGYQAEPFAGPLGVLKDKLAEIQQQLEKFLEDARTFEQEVQDIRTRDLRDIINAPMRWFRRWRYTAQLAKESSAIEAQLGEADRQIMEIREIPWELSLQCRETVKNLHEIRDTAEALRNKGVRGQALQTIINQAPILLAAMDEIPPRFYEADREALLAATSKKVTIQVHDIFSRVSPAAHRYLPQVREWAQHHQKALNEYSELKLAGASLRQAIANPPAGLVVDDLQERLDQTAQLAASFSQRLQQPDVEELKPLSREITQLKRVVQDTERRLNHSRQQAGELSQTLADLSAAMDSLSERYGRLEKADTFPLVFDQSRPLLTDLRARLDALGAPQKPRTPDEIARHLKSAQEIRAGLTALEQNEPAVEELYQSLVALLRSPELSEGVTWQRQAGETLEQAALFDPRNFPKSDMILALPGELETLRQPQKELVPTDPSAPVLESTLEQRLKDTQKLADSYKALRPRVESVRSRLQKILSLEDEGKDRLGGSYTALERVAILTETNELLDEITSAEIERLREEIRQAANELATRDQGEIEKKLSRIQTVTEKVNRALNNWIEQINESITELGKTVNETLVQLNEIGSLDEPSVIEAQNLLTRDEYLSALRGPGASSTSTAGRLRKAVLQRQSQLNDLEATAEIKRKADFWLTMQSTNSAMQERTGTLLEAYQEAMQARSEARERVAEITKRVPRKRTWPPNNQPPFDETLVLGPADDRWKSMKNSLPRSIDTAILEVGRLTQQYRLAIERAEQALNRIEQDEERVHELEEEIKELKQRWQAQQQADPNNALIREGVSHLMNKADERMSFIRQQYIRGAISYEETLHNLRLLNDELYSARIPVDEQNDIGLNETPRHIGAG